MVYCLTRRRSSISLGREFRLTAYSSAKWECPEEMKKRRIIMALGFVAAFTGDWFLVICGCGVRKPGFLGGVAAFTCAHLLWMAANGRESKIEWKALLVVLLPIAGFFSARVWGRIPASVFWATSGYTVVSALSLAVAVGTRRAGFARR